MLRISYFLLFTLLLAVSCETPKTYTDITVNEQFVLSLPADMVPADLDDKASMQYQAADRELYVMVLDESKETLNGFGLEYDLATYAKVALHNFDSTATVTPAVQKIGDYKAMHAGLNRKVQSKGREYDAVYRLTVIETPKNFYQILTWTMSSWYDKNRADMEHMEGSFRELAVSAK